MRIFHGLAMLALGFVLCACGGWHYNAKTGNIPGLQAELESGASIETRDNLGNTPLIVAVYSRQTEAVEYLCRKGADVNAQNNDRATALIHAAYFNLIDAAEILVKYNADKTIKDKYGNTALDYARKYEYVSMISLLNDA
jgi:ankyrin repeat protein